MPQQLDLFSVIGKSPDPPSSALGRHLDSAGLDDASLAAAIPQAGITVAAALASEAGRRRLAAAVPALRELCRRLTGIGADRPVPEQIAALEALAAIGGAEARGAVAWMIAKAVVIGPTLTVALDVAARLGAIVPPQLVAGLLRHDDPMMRANACRCARPGPAAIPLLLELLTDLTRDVRTAAACALGRMGRTEARPVLLEQLAASPSSEVIDAVAAIADERCIVLLARTARVLPGLAEAALDALDAIGHPRAEELAAKLRSTA